MKTPNGVTRWWVTRHRDWVTGPALAVSLLGGALLALTITMFFQTLNARLAGYHGVTFVPVAVLVFYTVGQGATLWVRPLMKRFKPRLVIVTSLAAMIATTFAVRVVTKATEFVIVYTLWSLAHFTAIVAMSTLYRMMLPVPTDIQRRGFSFWRAACYCFGAGATLILMFGMNSNQRIWLLVAVPFVALLTLLFVPLPQLEGTANEVSATKRWFDWKAFQVAVPYASVIVVSNMMLSLLQFHLGPAKVFGYTAAMFVLTISQIVSGFGGVLPIRLAEKTSDFWVSLLALISAGASALCFISGNTNWSIVGGLLIGFAICAGRISFSQLAATYASGSERGEPESSVTIRTGQITGAVLGLLLTFGVATLKTIWWAPFLLIILSIVYFLILNRHRMSR